jgi:energy-coupling factor transporter transmembrane protein EcfT
MIEVSKQKQHAPQSPTHTASHARKVGTLGHLALMIWTLGIVFALPPAYSPLMACLVFAVGGLAYPAALRRLLRLRWLFLFGLLILPHALWMHQHDTALFSVPLSTTGVLVGLRMALRAAVVILVIDIFSRTVDITEVAGLLERVGMKGLGFSLGIAVNLLPSLRQSSQHAWYSLRMRGGLRAQRWRGISCFLVTVITNALRRAEDIALAAETRAFSPERARAHPLKQGKLDLLIIVGCGVSVLSLVLLAHI